MTDIRRYQPHCKTCGNIHQPCLLETAVEVCAGHRMKHPNHKTSWIRLPSKPVKEKK